MPGWLDLVTLNRAQTKWFNEKPMIQNTQSVVSTSLLEYFAVYGIQNSGVEIDHRSFSEFICPKVNFDEMPLSNTRSILKNEYCRLFLI